jgi:asparagine synthase (glutamine-hydrolysing)
MRTKYLLAELEDKIIDTVTNYVARVPRPFGIVLSGGFDSGLLAALTKPNFAYRVKFPYGTKFDESIYADAISKHLSLPIKEIVITKENFQENFTEAVKVMGEPTTHFSLVPLYIMFKTFKKDGVKDILSGEGPDEYLGGYARQIIFDELRKLYEIPELRNYHGLINKSLKTQETILKLKNQFVWQYGNLVGYDEGQITNYFNSDYPLQGAIGKMDMELGVIEKMEQKFAQHFGINFHYPYINEELAEYCYHLPDNMKIRNGVTKWGFRKIALKYLPPLLKDRAKMGGPVAPVNKLMGWEDLGDFEKGRYLEEQKKILNG